MRIIIVSQQLSYYSTQRHSKSVNLKEMSISNMLINSQLNATQLNSMKSDNDYWFICHPPTRLRKELVGHFKMNLKQI